MTTKEAKKIINFLELAQRVENNGDIYYISISVDFFEGKEVPLDGTVKEILENFKENFKNIQKLWNLSFSLKEIYSYESFTYGHTSIQSHENRYKGTIKRFKNLPLEEQRKIKEKVEENRKIDEQIKKIWGK